VKLCSSKVSSTESEVSALLVHSKVQQVAHGIDLHHSLAFIYSQ